MTMIVMQMFRLMSLNMLVGIIYEILQKVRPNNIKNIGSRPVNSTLNIGMFGVIVITFESLTNQSNDKKASEDVPIFSAGNII